MVSDMVSDNGLDKWMDELVEWRSLQSNKEVACISTSPSNLFKHLTLPSLVDNEM